MTFGWGSFQGGVGESMDFHRPVIKLWPPTCANSSTCLHLNRGDARQSYNAALAKMRLLREG